MRLTNILIASGMDLKGQYKFHLASHTDESPLDVFFRDEFQQWQEYQNKRNFQCDKVISLIQYGKNRWLFAGVYAINGCSKVGDHYEYDTTLLPDPGNLIGRLIVTYHRKVRQSYFLSSTIENDLTISSIREHRLIIEEFPGYNSVCITHSKLSLIMKHQEQTWYGALANVKGVYLITDTHTGKLYVGSAQGDVGLWNRWGEYLYTGHGGNKDLKRLLAENGMQYASHFQYTLLEISSMHMPDELILSRESFWKNALSTRIHGYNKN